MKIVVYLEYIQKTVYLFTKNFLSTGVTILTRTSKVIVNNFVKINSFIKIMIVLSSFFRHKGKFNLILKNIANLSKFL